MSQAPRFLSPGRAALLKSLAITLYGIEPPVEDFNLCEMSYTKAG
jgi:hypothetical protein